MFNPCCLHVITVQLLWLNTLIFGRNMKIFFVNSMYCVFTSKSVILYVIYLFCYGKYEQIHAETPAYRTYFSVTLNSLSLIHVFRLFILASASLDSATKSVFHATGTDLNIQTHNTEKKTINLMYNVYIINFHEHPNCLRFTN